MFLTFWTQPRWAGSEHIQHAVHDAHGHDDHPDAEAAGHAAHDDHHHGPVTGTAGYHPHESPWTMRAPAGDPQHRRGCSAAWLSSTPS